MCKAGYGEEMAKLREAVIVDFLRTPFGRAGKKRPGFFADVRSDDLGIIVVQARRKLKSLG